MVDILEREGDSAREDKTRATTLYWAGSAQYSKACSMQGWAEAGRSGGSGLMWDRHPLQPERARPGLQQLQCTGPAASLQGTWSPRCSR